MKHLFAILTYLMLTQNCLGQSITSFAIDQVDLPSVHYLKYKFDGKKLIVIENGRILRKLRLDPEEINQLDSVFNSIDIDTLKESYSIGLIDGTNHTFFFRYGGNEKTISLNSYYIENLDRFLDAVNRLLKEEYQLIHLENEGYHD